MRHKLTQIIMGEAFQTTPPDQANLSIFRLRLLNLTWSVGNVLVGLAYIPSAIYLIQIHDWRMLISISFLMFISVGLMLVKSAKYIHRSIALSSLVYFAGLTLIILRGPFSTGAIWLFLFCVILSALMGRRSALLGITISTITLSTVCVLMEFGILDRSLEDPHTMGAWPFHVVLFAMLTGFGSLAIAYLLEAMGKALDSRDKSLEISILSQKRYRDIFNNSLDLICTHDMHGVVTAASASACEVLGLDSSELLGSNIRDLLPSEYKNDFESYLEEVTTEGSATGIMKVTTEKAGRRFLEYKNRLVRESNQEPYILGSARDITEQLLASKEKEKLQEELAHAKRIESLGILAGGIAHDFNNILAIILGYAEIAHDRALQDEARPQEIKHILDASHRAKELIRRILAFSRRDNPRLRLADVNEVISSSVQLLQRTLPKTIIVETNLAADLPLTPVDGTQLAQVIINMGTNAIDAMPSGGKITINSLYRIIDEEYSKTHHDLSPGPYACIIITDTGTGLSKEKIDHVFDPFFTTKEVGKGTGLGLSTSHSIIKAHKGHIACHSQLGIGTIFQIFLPISNPNYLQEEPDRIAVDPEDISGSETLLIVDDEQDIRDIIVRSIVSRGYKVFTASNGAEAVHIYKQDHGSIDLVIMDLNMPVMNGYEASREMLSINPKAKILIASGYLEPEKLAGYQLLNIAGSIPKPFTVVQLLQRARDILG